MLTPRRLAGGGRKAAMQVEVQLAASVPHLPSAGDFRRWAECAMQGEDGELCVRVVDREEAKALSVRYRGVAAPTNVLSFPLDDGGPPHMPRLLGDLAVCAPLVAEEAKSQAKALADHFAHLVVHGVLHLRGYDHKEDSQARRMERLEKAILGGLGIADPYQPLPASEPNGGGRSRLGGNRHAAPRPEVLVRTCGVQP